MYKLRGHLLGDKSIFIFPRCGKRLCRLSWSNCCYYVQASLGRTWTIRNAGSVYARSYAPSDQSNLTQICTRFWRLLYSEPWRRIRSEGHDETRKEKHFSRKQPQKQLADQTSGITYWTSSSNLTMLSVITTVTSSGSVTLMVSIYD